MHVALIFTEGVSLKTWREQGLILRDSLLYERLCAEGHRVTFVTYGKPDDEKYLPVKSRIEVLARPRDLSRQAYGRKLASVHGPALRDVDLIKAHQLRGARFAAWAAWRLRKPFIARCGYLPSVFLRDKRAGWLLRARARMEAGFAFHRCDAAMVPGPSEADYVRDHYAIDPRKIHLAPNWIDTERFAPGNEDRQPRRICFVGRFVQQKQPLALLEVLKDIPDIELMMIGSGEMEPAIRAKIAEYGIRATILGQLENEAIPALLRQSALYVLPSLHEGGSPKTLLEAMACGLPVVSTNAFGVNDAFEDRQHGFKLAPHDIGGMSRAVQWLLSHPDEARAMGERGRAHVIANYSIERAVERELRLYAEVLAARRGAALSPSGA